MITALLAPFTSNARLQWLDAKDGVVGGGGQLGEVAVSAMARQVRRPRTVEVVPIPRRTISGLISHRMMGSGCTYGRGGVTLSSLAVSDCAILGAKQGPEGPKDEEHRAENDWRKYRCRHLLASPRRPSSGPISHHLVSHPNRPTHQWFRSMATMPITNGGVKT